MRDTAGAHTVGAEEALRRVRTEGWCVIDDAIPHQELAAVRDSISASLAGRSELRGVIACDRSFASYLVDERLTAVTTGMFGPESRIARTDAFAAEPGAAGSGWHADWPFSGDDSYRVAVPYGDLAMAVNTLWMLTDAPADAGATLIASGSHRTHDNPAVAPGYAADAEIASQMLPEVPAGSVLAFDSRLWHRTTTNAGGERRLWLDIQYVPWWLDVTSMIPGLADYETRAEGLGYRPVEIRPLDEAAFGALPDAVKPLFDHLRLDQGVIAWHPDAPSSS